MTMKFYMTPGSCSTGIHILLEELELVFEVYVVNLLEGGQNTTEYLTINPKGTIPTLVREDGTSLTDFQSIAWWLAQQYPKAGFLPNDSEKLLKVIEVMNCVIGTIHMQGFARIFTTDKFTPNEADYEWVKQQGRDIIDKGFIYIASILSDQDYVLDDFSIADVALFYVEFWADKTDIELPKACQRHYQQMLIRPKVRQVLTEEGYSL